MINNNYEANLPFWEKDEWSIEEFLRARIERYGYIKSILDQSDTWRHGFTDAMHAIVRFIMLAHIASIEEAWHEFPDLN